MKLYVTEMKITKSPRYAESVTETVYYRFCLASLPTKAISDKKADLD